MQDTCSTILRGKKEVTFKGGTSSSKGQHFISWFSWDIDLILEWCIL